MVLEIFTYGGGDYLVEVLNAVVRVMGANSFTTALRIFALFGMFSVLFDIALSGNFSKGVKYYISFLLLYNVLFVPKVDVLITDPINQIQGDRKVDNVPFGLGFVAHTVSALGNWMADVFGMNFVLPNDLQYNKNGILFGSTLIKDTFNARIPDGRTSNNFNSYIRQCIIPAINLKRVKSEDFLRSASIQEFLDVGKNGVLAYDFINTSGERQINLCNDTIEIAKDINAEVDKLIKQQENTFNKNNNVNIADVNQYILGIQQSTTKTFEQNLIANAINDSTQEYLSMTGADAGATNYAITKDDMQRKTNSILQWLQAGRFLPLMKICIEMFFYALFPIVILLTMLPNGIKIFKNYILILLALQVWSPLYAILNLAMTLEQKYKVSNIIAQTGNSLSLYNKQAVMDIVQGIQTQAGILAFFIPPISFAIVKGMQNFGESMASGIASAGSYATSQVVSEVASGNLSYGNGSFKNTSYGNESFDNKNYNNISGNQFKAMRLNLTSTEDQVNSSRIALSEAKSANESYSSSLTKSKQNLEDFITSNTNFNSKNHSYSNTDVIKGNAGSSIGVNLGIFKASGGVDYEKANTWADSQNITGEKRKAFNEMIQKHNSLQTNYTNSEADVKSKQRMLDYNLATSVHSGIDWNKEGYNYLKEHGYSDEWIDTHQQEAQKLCNSYIKSKIFNSNKPYMLDNVNNSLEINKNQYNNQNSIIGDGFDYQKNSLDKNNQLHQMKNTDFSVLDWNIKRKSD